MMSYNKLPSQKHIIYL